MWSRYQGLSYLGGKFSHLEAKESLAFRVAQNFVYGVVCFVFVFFLQDVNIVTPSVLMHHFLRMESKILKTLHHLKLMGLKR